MTKRLALIFSKKTFLFLIAILAFVFFVFGFMKAGGWVLTAHTFTPFPSASPRTAKQESTFPYRIVANKKTGRTYLIRIVKPYLVLQVKTKPLTALTTQDTATQTVLPRPAFAMSLEELAKELGTTKEELLALEAQVQAEWEAYKRNPNPQLETLKRRMLKRFYNIFYAILQIPRRPTGTDLTSLASEDTVRLYQAFYRDSFTSNAQALDQELAGFFSIPDVPQSSQILLDRAGNEIASPNFCFRQGKPLTGGYNAWAPCCDCDLCFGDDGDAFIDISPPDELIDGDPTNSCTPPQCVEIPPASQPPPQVLEIPPTTQPPPLPPLGECPPGSQVCLASLTSAVNSVKNSLSNLFGIALQTEVSSMLLQQGDDCGPCMTRVAGGQCQIIPNCQEIPPLPGDQDGDGIPDDQEIPPSGQCPPGEQVCEIPPGDQPPGGPGDQEQPPGEEQPPSSGPVCIPIGCLNLICHIVTQPAIWDPLTGLCGCDP